MKLKELRISQSLTQTECANYLGVSLRTYQNYENDSTKEHKKELFLDDNFSEVIIKIQVHKRELICMHKNHNRLLNLLI